MACPNLVDKATVKPLERMGREGWGPMDAVENAAPPSIGVQSVTLPDPLCAFPFNALAPQYLRADSLPHRFRKYTALTSVRTRFPASVEAA